MAKGTVGGRRRCAHEAAISLSLLSGLILSVAALTSPPLVSGHSQQCTAAGVSGWTGYLVVFENDDESPPSEDACGFDSNYHNGAGPIQNFHDKMTGFHFRDRDDGESRCVRFFASENYSGATFIANSGPMTGGSHYVDAHVGSFNDKADSHQWYRAQGGSCNIQVSGGGDM